MWAETKNEMHTPSFEGFHAQLDWELLYEHS